MLPKLYNENKRNNILDILLRREISKCLMRNIFCLSKPRHANLQEDKEKFY